MHNMKQPLNAHLNTKSAIQLVTETIVAKEAFFENLRQLTEQYDIQDNVFCCDVAGDVHELKEGYFGQVAEYDNIVEAKQNCNILLQGIRVHGDKYAVGNLYRNLVDVKEDVIIDLAKSIVL